MSIGRGSCYDTFGDRPALFLASLDRFQEVRTSWLHETWLHETWLHETWLHETWLHETLEAPGSGLDAVREVFRRTVDGLPEFEPRRGCLLANSAAECAPHDAEVVDRISGHVRRTEAASGAALLRAGEAGETPPGRDPAATARFLVNTLHGLRVLARAGSDREALEGTVRVDLRVALEVLR